MWIVSLVVASVATTGGIGQTLAAAPAAVRLSAENPDAPLELWRPAATSKLLAEAVKLHADVVTGLANLREKRQSHQLKQRGVLKRVGDVHVALLSLSRAANKLAAMREPAGIDLRLRAEALRAELRPIIEETRRLQADTIEKSRDYLDKMGGDMKRRRILEKAETLRLEGKLEQAEALVLPAYNKMELMGVWYVTSVDRDASLLPFDLWLNPFDTEMIRKLEDDSRDALAERASEVTPKFDELLEQLMTASESVGKTGMGAFADESLSGPEIVRRFAAAWTNIQRSAAETWAMDQAFERQTEIKAQREAWRKFNDDFAAGIVGLIAADAKRASDSEAKQLYSQYCGVLAPLVGLVDEQVLREPADAALYQFVVKSPSLRQNWFTYQQATHDLLRWRQKTAKLRAAAFSKGHINLQGDNTLPREIKDPAPVIMASISKQLSGKRVRGEDLLGAGPRRVTTDLNSAAIVTIDQDDDNYCQVHATVLRGELLASSVYPMLSLDVAAAIAETERGDLVAAGGVVRDYALRPLVPLLANCRPDDVGLLRIGVLPAGIGASHAPLSEALIEVSIQPEWLQQRYFCISLADLSASGASDESKAGESSADKAVSDDAPDQDGDGD